jgi:UDP-glucose-4-epimerase GalE
MSWIAVTGGCGYIGSHIAKQLGQLTSHNILLIDRNADNLRHTHGLADRFVCADFVSDDAFDALRATKPRTIIHCGGTSLVGPSIANPAEYYDNNVFKTVRLLDWIRDYADGTDFIFSSSSSIYGDTPTGICDERTEKNPISPYARTKWIIEQVLQDYGRAYGINSLSFRYFNAAGADSCGLIGQLPHATHLLAAVIEHVLYNRQLEIYGDDYDTPDGTPIRDYTHVTDIAQAHVLGIDWLAENPGCHSINLGTGRGSSVKEILTATERALDVVLSPAILGRREGDPAKRAASNDLAAATLGWKPKRSLDEIVLTAHAWYNSEAYRRLRFANK